MFVPVEEALIARARFLIPEVGDRTPSVGDLLEGESVPATPAIAIAYDGYTKVGEAGVDNLIESRWLLAVAASSARQRDGARDARIKALDIAGRLLEGLVGWRPERGYSPFELANPGGPIWIKSRGLYLLPVAVCTRHVISGVDEY